MSASVAGTYTVTNTIAAAGGCGIVTATNTITITTLPTATISYTGSPWCSSAPVQNVTFIGTPGGTYSALPAGLSINAATGAITPGTSTSGTYAITYTIAASGGCGVVTATTNITVNAAPTVVVTNPAAVCAPSTVDLTAAAVTAGSTAGLTYTYWTDALATTAYATPATAVAGTYYIKGTDAVTGCFDIKPVIATVNAAPTVVVTNPAAVCAPSTVDLTAAAVTAGSTAGLTYTYWTDALATTAYATPATAVAGTYYIKGTDAVTSCYDIKPVTATVNAAPTVVVTNPAEVCAPSTIDLTAAAVTAGSTDDPQFFQTSRPANETQEYLEISSDGVRLTGNLTFSDGKRQASSFSLPLTADLKNSILFSNAGQNGLCSAAVVLLNPGDNDVSAKVELYSGDGKLLAVAADVIPPHARRSRLMADYFPGITGPDWISGYIKIVTDLPIAAFSSLGNSDSSILSVIPSQDIP